MLQFGVGLTGEPASPVCVTSSSWLSSTSASSPSSPFSILPTVFVGFIPWIPVVVTFPGILLILWVCINRECLARQQIIANLIDSPGMVYLAQRDIILAEDLGQFG